MNLLLSKLKQWKVLILLNAVYLAAGLAWIILIPYNNAPDENTHFHYTVEFILQHHRLPVWGVDDIERFRHALSSYNQMPALNYILYAAGAAIGQKLFGLETYLGARLVSLLWGFVFLNFLFLALQEACGSQKNALIVAASIAFIPQVFFSFCYVNADAHSLAIAAILGLTLTRFLRAQTRIEGRASALSAIAAMAKADYQRPSDSEKAAARQARALQKTLNFLDMNIIFAGAAIGLLFSAKYNYYIYFPCIAIILAWAALRRLIAWRTIGRLIIASAVLSLLISGFWFIRNYFLYGNPLPILMSEDFFRQIALAREVRPVNHGLNIASFVWLAQQGFLSSTFDSFFAVFGYLNVGFHRAVYILLEFAVPALAVFFIIQLIKTRDRPAILLLAMLLIMIGVIMAMHAWACLTYDYQAQGRYNFTILLPAALFVGWAVTRQTCLRKYAVAFLIIMIGLFIGANLLIIRTYAPPVQFAVSWSGTDQSFKKPVVLKATKTQKNYYATEKIAVGNEPASGLRMVLSDKFLARYRDCKVELETNDGLINVDFSSCPPGHLVNATFDNKLNAIEAAGQAAGFILPLSEVARVKSLRISCRIENRRLYDLGH